MATATDAHPGTEHLILFAQLAAKFGPDQVKRRPGKGSQELLYITARTVMNRLDDVLGPDNWWDHYTETKDGIKCSLTIRLPDGREVTKEDGGGFSTLGDDDDQEKSGYSSAFKRAAVKFGVGRHLYNDGVPQFVRDVLNATGANGNGR